MYRRIVLAYDSTPEGRAALREGAVLARFYNADVFLLSVLPDTLASSFAEGVVQGAAGEHLEAYRQVLEEGLARLRELGFAPVGEVVRGEPVRQIGDYARRVGADLIVVGHKRQTFLERWWSGSTGANMVDNVDCTLLVARQVISDAEFEAQIATLAEDHLRLARLSSPDGQGHTASDQD